MRMRSPRMAPWLNGLRRVDGDDAERLAAAPQLAGERAAERALSGAGGSGEADGVRAAGVRVELRERATARRARRSRSG